MKTPKIILYIILFLYILPSCSNATETDFKPDLNPVKIILDTDMGSDCDDAGALALLHVYADKGLAEIVGCIYSSGKVPYGAGIIEAINIYYGKPDIPIGAYYGNEVGDPVDKMNAEKLANDTAAFGNKIIHNTDTDEQTRLNRKLLTRADDNSIVYVTIGHTKGLHELLVSTPDDISPLSGFDLVSKKLKSWVALGALNARNDENNFVKDWNFTANNTAPYTDYLVNNFPVTIYFIDAGNEVMTGKTLINTPEGNIVRRVYEEWLWNTSQRTLDRQRPSWDLAAVYFAVFGEGDFLENTGSGLLEFDMGKGSRWKEDNNNNNNTNQFYIVQKENTDESFADYLNELIGRIPD
jgi:hypothetical protein